MPVAKQPSCYGPAFEDDQVRNVREGSRRIKLVGQLTALVTLSLTLIVVATQLFMPTFVYLLAALLTFKAVILAGLALWAAGWVMEGFSSTK
jgi:uncharacterized membrane protein